MRGMFCSVFASVLMHLSDKPVALHCGWELTVRGMFCSVFARVLAGPDRPVALHCVRR